jgi:WXG100 family type VII secretion target
MSEASGELVVHYGSLEETAKDIKNAAGVVRREIDAMRKAVSDVAHGWEGEAHQAMLQADAMFRARSEHIQKTLDQVSKLVLEGSEHYYATDRKASKLFDISY